MTVFPAPAYPGLSISPNAQFSSQEMVCLRLTKKEKPFLQQRNLGLVKSRIVHHFLSYCPRLLCILILVSAMPVFQSKTFRRATTASSSLGERIGETYRARLPKHPFLLFGLPFVMIIVAGSFALTPAAALRYERYDRKVQQLSQEEAMNLGLRGPDGEEGIRRNPRRRIIGDEREEYYVSYSIQPIIIEGHIINKLLQRLMAKDLDNWEQKRVQRFKGEPDGKL